MLGLLAVWPERLGAGSVGGAGWAALFYCHFLAVPLSLPLSRLSVLSLPSPGRRWLCCLTGWGIASAGGGWVSLCPPAGRGCCAGFLGRRRWLLSSPCLASSPSPGCWLWGLVLLSPSVLSPGCWRSSAVLWCWPAMRWGWVLALGGVGAGLSRPWRWWLAGGWCAAIWRAWASLYCTNTALQIWLFFKRKAINFERFFLDIAHKVRYNNTRVKEIVNPLQLTASPLLGGGWTEERNQLINLKGDRQNET